MNEAQHQPPIEPTPALQQTRTDSLKGSESSSSTRGVVDVARHVDDEWRRWIAENLMLGASPERARDAMVGSRDLMIEEATCEIDLAMQQPLRARVPTLLCSIASRARLAARHLPRTSTA